MLIKHYFAATPNLGDTAIGVGARKLIREIFPSAEIMTFRSNKGYYDHGTHAPSAELLTFDQRLDQVSGIGPASFRIGERPDLVVIGGAEESLRINCLEKKR